ncbi:hypothetical protein PSKAS_07290 [Peribacillus sp. N1]
MFGSLNRTKLIKNDLKSIAKLMYQDVSKEPNKEKFRFHY